MTLPPPDPPPMPPGPVPPPAGPGWAVPPAAPSPPPPQGRSPVGPIVAVLAVVGVLVGVFVLAGGDDDGGDGGGAATGAGAAEDELEPINYGEEPDADGNLPQNVVTDFVAAVESVDCEALAATVNPSTRDDVLDEMVEGCPGTLEPDPSPASVEDLVLQGYYAHGDVLPHPDVESGTAIVDAVVVDDGQRQEREYWVEMREGLWMIYRVQP